VKPVIENNKDKIVLSNDPKIALAEIAGYLSSINYHRSHAVFDADDKYLLGYWQTPEYLQGIVDIKLEIERIIQL